MAVLLVCVPGLAAAAALTGTVQNLTTGRPAASDVVLLLSMGRTPAVIGRARTDSGGRFRFDGELPVRPLVRVVHQGVTYDKVAPPGVNSVEIEVWDAAREVEPVRVAWEVQRIETTADSLRVVQEIGVRNASDPPRTLVSDSPLEFQLPDEAELVAGKTQLAGGPALARSPAPAGGKGRYSFPAVLPPGESRFAVAYRVPYRGEAVIRPTILFPVEQFVVAVPKSVRFEAEPPSLFRAVPAETWANVQQSIAVRPGQPLAFRISGTGRLEPRQAVPPTPVLPAAQRAAPARLAARSNDRWLLLGALGLVLASVAAGVFAHHRKRA